MIKAFIGTDDDELIFKALTDHDGDIEKAIEEIMKNMPDDYGDEGETDAANKK